MLFLREVFLFEEFGVVLAKSFESELACKRIFLTGHTGFTGSWASLWLNSIGAQVFGYSLAPETSPNLFTEAGIDELVDGKIADIRDFDELHNQMAMFEPDLVLHLAAQPLVRRSYRIPRETFEINAQGTANVLEAARLVSSIKGVLCITTDKVYKNFETDYRYVESDELGGKDPYSSSKAAAELIISSYRDSFRVDGSSALIAVARGGNIVGGGDWSEDRLIPDYIRAFVTGKEMSIRFPDATRPWQHVLSLIDGYLTILAGMLGTDASKYDQAFNLGPIETKSFSVSSVLSLLTRELPGVRIKENSSELHEAGKLGLNSDLAISTFGWKPSWDTSEVIDKTASWYRDFLSEAKPARQLCLDQIDSWKRSESKF
jgi:CDP-glucose 4,6-dehydratase